MEVRTIDRSASRIAERRLRLIRLQESAAALARKGEAEGARRERAKLLSLLHELDVLEAQRGGGEAA